MKHVKSHQGFTIIELMFVVSIIGILASLGVASFSNMIYKTQQNQAKSQMTVVYNGLRNFHAEWNQYFADFRNLGIELNGDFHYRVGFQINSGVGTAAKSPTNYIGPGVPDGGDAIQILTNPAAGYCGAAGSSGFPCTELTSEVSGLDDPPCTWAANTFTICGRRNTYRSANGTTTYDWWELNEAKVWTNIQL